MFFSTMRTTVSGSSAATAAARRRALHSSAQRFAAAKHTTDTYAKDDVDATPPPSESTVYKIDTTSDTVQKPSEQIPSLESRKSYADVDMAKGKKEGYESVEGSSYKTQGGEKSSGSSTGAKAKGPTGEAAHGRS
ncbi:hypothetical protein BKA70DRAFT_540215 [Coprinopsis sp. MPI-PUGE-AT-0042]|nr:hypothetical protein BKA70DRAFT_540215 [Coprinopsis sp. MPI-PUGE-AT-0042]